MPERDDDAQRRRGAHDQAGDPRDQGSPGRLKVDLHTHTRFSDGTATPADLVRRAKSAGLALLAVTDHDSVSGFPEARAAAGAAGVPLLCGIEINTAYKDNVHVLGFGFKETPGFLSRLEEFRGRRVERIRRIVERIRGLGLALEFEDVKAASHETLGRPHVADALKRRGLVGGRQEAFDRFLAKGKPGYVESMGPSVEEAIALVRDAGGFCSLAHPDTVPDREAEIARWKGLGLEGLEVYYGAHSPSDLVRYRRLADGLGLLCTGGSDFHGPGTGREKALGIELPEDCYARFMERLARCS